MAKRSVEDLENLLKEQQRKIKYSSEFKGSESKGSESKGAESKGVESKGVVTLEKIKDPKDFDELKKKLKLIKQ